MLGLQEFNMDLSTSLGRVSSMRIFVPWVGELPKAHTDREDNKSQSYFVWKNLPSCGVPFVWDNIKNYLRDKHTIKRVLSHLSIIPVQINFATLKLLG